MNHIELNTPTPPRSPTEHNQNFDSEFLTKQTETVPEATVRKYESKYERKSVVKSNLNLTELWSSVLDAYDIEWRHEEFVMACYRQGCLNHAAQKYARILHTSPTESIALRMQGQIDALVSKDRYAKYNPAKPQKSKISSMIAVIGLVIALLGFLGPHFKNCVGVGIAIFVLAWGLRYFKPEI